MRPNLFLFSIGAFAGRSFVSASVLGGSLVFRANSSASVPPISDVPTLSASQIVTSREGIKSASPAVESAVRFIPSPTTSARRKLVPDSPSTSSSEQAPTISTTSIRFTTAISSSLPIATTEAVSKPKPTPNAKLDSTPTTSSPILPFQFSSSSPSSTLSTSTSTFLTTTTPEGFPTNIPINVAPGPSSPAPSVSTVRASSTGIAASSSATRSSDLKRTILLCALFGAFMLIFGGLVLCVCLRRRRMRKRREQRGREVWMGKFAEPRTSYETKRGPHSHNNSISQQPASRAGPNGSVTTPQTTANASATPLIPPARAQPQQQGKTAHRIGRSPLATAAPIGPTSPSPGASHFSQDGHMARAKPSPFVVASPTFLTNPPTTPAPVTPTTPWSADSNSPRRMSWSTSQRMSGVVQTQRLSAASTASGDSNASLVDYQEHAKAYYNENERAYSGLDQNVYGYAYSPSVDPVSPYAAHSGSNSNTVEYTSRPHASVDYADNAAYSPSTDSHVSYSVDTHASHSGVGYGWTGPSLVGVHPFSAPAEASGTSSNVNTSTNPFTDPDPFARAAPTSPAQYSPTTPLTPRLNEKSAAALFRLTHPEHETARASVAPAYDAYPGEFGQQQQSPPQMPTRLSAYEVKQKEYEARQAYRAQQGGRKDMPVYKEKDARRLFAENEANLGRASVAPPVYEP